MNEFVSSNRYKRGHLIGEECLRQVLTYWGPTLHKVQFLVHCEFVVIKNVYYSLREFSRMSNLKVSVVNDSFQLVISILKN